MIRPDPSEAVEAFVTCLSTIHPTWRVTCDWPVEAKASTWIDVRFNSALIVVEYQPERGFGFAKSSTGDDNLYGTPSAYFIRAADAAAAHLDEVS